MPFNNHPSNEFLRLSSEDMVFGLDLRRTSSKRHSISKTAKESSVLHQTSRIPKDDEEKLKSKSDLKQKAKKDVEGKIENRGSFRRSGTQSDELVKHMSNLPGYLLRPDRGDKNQEKAFNVGVLDWSRLEKWKHNHNHMPVLASNLTPFKSSGSSTSSSSSRAATKSTTSVGVKEKPDKKKGLASSDIKPSNREFFSESSNKLPCENVKRRESSRSKTRSIGDEQIIRALESFGETRSDILHGKGRRNEYSKRISRDGSFASSSRHHGVSHVPNEIAEGRDDGAKQNKDGLREHNRKKKERHHRSGSDIGMLSVRSKNKEDSVNAKKMSSSSRVTGKRVDQLQGLDFDIGPKLRHSHSRRSNNVLLYPQEIPQPSSSGDFRLSELRTSSDENTSGSSQSNLSYVSLAEEVCAEDVCSEIPLSSALSSAELTSSWETKRSSIGANLDIDCSSIVSETHASASRKIPNRHSLGTFPGKDLFDTNLRNQCVFGNIKESLEQEAAEPTAQRSINSSHSRRFSFSLSRLGRSFSFKEGPTLPHLSSIYVGAKSGPVTPESSVRWDNLSKEKGNSSRIKSSPLRRLFDPLLRHKASGSHSAESSQAQKGSMNSIDFTAISFNESLPAETSKGLSVQGLLQLTMKNGLPLFKFVLNNERKILAATRRSLSSLEKDDIGCYFTFYLVNEIKKKSGGWMGHGSKEKSCGYAYNCIAQMKFSSSKITEPINHNAKRQRLVKEYVLMGVEIGQTEQGQPRFVQSGELAAVVIETPCENSSIERMHSDSNLLKKGCFKCLGDERCLCRLGENDNSCSTTVILPGGVHGSPNKGEPSPLIYRWKTRGSCDCGGWDIGCKLLVLSNQKQRPEILKCLKPFNDQDRFQLFVQEGAEQDEPLFTLLPLKDGFYSVEFSSSITYLQAFFISVAVLSCQKLPSSLEMGSMFEEILKEPSSKNNSRFQGKSSLKYATPIPPLSPVGRV